MLNRTVGVTAATVLAIAGSVAVFGPPWGLTVATAGPVTSAAPSPAEPASDASHKRLELQSTELDFARAPSEPNREEHIANATAAPSELGPSGQVRDLEQQLAAARARIVGLERELDRLAHPERTPWGSFVHSPASERLTDPKHREQMRFLLVVETNATLLPHEADWIADRILNDDWSRFADTQPEAVIHYLGARRLQECGPTELISVYMEHFPNLGWAPVPDKTDTGSPASDD